jgi:hypothetical protein
MLNAIYHYDEVRGEINHLYFSLLLYTFYFTLVIIAINQSTPLNYIRINLGKLNDTKPIILEVRYPHIDPILQGFVLLRAVFIIGTLHITSSRSPPNPPLFYLLHTVTEGLQVDTPASPKNTDTRLPRPLPPHPWM